MSRPRDRLGRPLPPGAEDERLDPRPPEAWLRGAADAAAWARRLCADGRYFEAHEVLEQAWRAADTPDADRLLFKGAAQAAVAACHHQRGNRVGARRVAAKAAETLARAERTRPDLDGAALAAWARRAEAALRAGRAPSPLRLPAPTSPSPADPG